MDWPSEADNARCDVNTYVNSRQGATRINKKTTPERSGVVEGSYIYDQNLLVVFLCDHLLANLDHVHAGVLDLFHHAAGHRV